MIQKKTIIAIASVGLAATFAFVAFAQTTNTSTASNTAAKISCIGGAVNTRETAIDSAMTAYTAAVNSAYSARAAALQAAYGKTTWAEVKVAVKLAWSDYNKAVKAAKKAWVSARNSAWAKYRKEVAACRAPIGVGDGLNSGIEVSGQ